MTSNDIRELLARAMDSRRADRPDDARREFESAVDLARTRPLSIEFVAALKGLAQIERDSGRPEPAVALYEEAATACRSLNHDFLLAHTVRHLGDVLQDLGSIERAEPCYLEALSLYERRADAPTLDVANTIRPMAILRETQGDTAEAVLLWTKALRLYAECNVPAGVEECERRLRNLTGERGD
ncbi:MAG: tetratricopeptide repeat protein [Blastocatellia bacterium]|nr:tetratricopeptide repeat protein [Blastocatellia bacterium]